LILRLLQFIAQIVQKFAASPRGCSVSKPLQLQIHHDSVSESDGAYLLVLQRLYADAIRYASGMASWLAPRPDALFSGSQLKLSHTYRSNMSRHRLHCWPHGVSPWLAHSCAFFASSLSLLTQTALSVPANHLEGGYHFSRAGPGFSVCSFCFQGWSSLFIFSDLPNPQLTSQPVLQRLSLQPEMPPLQGSGQHCGCAFTGLCGKWQVHEPKHTLSLAIKCEHLIAARENPLCVTSRRFQQLHSLYPSQFFIGCLCTSRATPFNFL
jgi:hypothetical protein